jgi:hypothetical protein
MGNGTDDIDLLREVVQTFLSARLVCEYLAMTRHSNWRQKQWIQFRVKCMPLTEFMPNLASWFT